MAASDKRQCVEEQLAGLLVVADDVEFAGEVEIPPRVGFGQLAVVMARADHHEAEQNHDRRGDRHDPQDHCPVGAVLEPDAVPTPKNLIAGLFGERGDKMGMAVTQGGDSDTAGKVQVASPVGREEIGTLPPLESEVSLTIGVHQGATHGRHSQYV